MLNLLKTPTALGLELLLNDIKGAELSMQSGKPRIKNLFTTPTQNNSIAHVNPLYMNAPLLVTGLEGCDVLVRTLTLPLTKEKDIEASYAFQAEPLLPYPADQAILTRQTIAQNAENSTLTLLSAHKELLQKHVELWQQFKIEPEKIGCIQSALCQFSRSYIAGDKLHLILHMNDKWTTCILIKEGKLIAANSIQEGLDPLKIALKEHSNESLSEEKIDFSNSLETSPSLFEAVKRLQQTVVKVCYALMKESKGETIEGVVLTGELLRFNHLENRLIEKLNLPLLYCSEDTSDSFSPLEKQQYAVPIGLAIGALQNNSIDFRQQELTFPHPWRRLTVPLAGYFASMILLTTIFYFFGQSYLHYEEDKLKQEYVDLLTALNKPYDQFEQAYLLKNPTAREKANGEIVAVTAMNRNDLLERLEFVHKDVQGTPDSFPLFANIPLVSDVIAWLSTHPYVNHVNADGTTEARLELENFSYTMLKRPVQGKKQEKYQVKVELEFSSPTPKWAREFHDALIVPNDFVDPKSEVKWSTNRGHYRTSFYLKDKTTYPN